MTPEIKQALAHLRESGYGAEADAMESALASAEPVAWQARYRGISSSAEWMDVTQHAYSMLDGKYDKRALYTHAHPAAKVEAPDLVLQLLVAGGFVDPAEVDPAREIIAGCAPTPASVPDWVYLSGPMSGLPDLNFPAFHAAAKELRANGHHVISPAEINAAHPGEWSSCMRADIIAMCNCETLALLPGWESSRGAHLELHLAHRLGLKIVSVAALMPTTPEPTP